MCMFAKMIEILAPARPRVHALNNNKKQATIKIHGDIDRILPTSRVDDARYVMPHNLCHKICATPPGVRYLGAKR